MALFKSEGIDFLDYEPDVLWEAVKEHVDYPLGQIEKDKIQAGISLMVSNLAWEDHDVFENTVHALNETPVIFEERQVPEPEALIFAIQLIHKIRVYPYDENVLAYIAAVLQENDIVWLPDIWIPKEVPDLQHQLAANWPSELVKNVKKRFSELGDTQTFEETVEGIQLGKISIIKQYLQNSGALPENNL